MTSGQEIGAALAVYRDGVKIVDLWGGFRNGITKAPWEHDTLVNMYSTTKGVSALAVAVAASRGLISYDAKVADYLAGVCAGLQRRSNGAATTFTSSGTARP
jgi:CubicO group peptidase (beta-lactamase class C family)